MISASQCHYMENVTDIAEKSFKLSDTEDTYKPCLSRNVRISDRRDETTGNYY